ncbi:MAG: hypothetical protein ACTTG8_00160 [Catonella sp.]|uniref:hypothetical protein n=1 Tax=Catonella sp. TaxID=2382125 RepID=UPI003F9F2F32
MKKKIAILMCGIMSLTLFACGSKNDSKSSANMPTTSASQSKSITSSANSSKSSSSSIETDISNMKMTELLGKICEGTKVPANDVFDLDKDSFETYSFIKWSDGIKAVCSEGQISTDAHSLVLIKVNGADAKTMAEDIAKNADPRKWICVGAEKSGVLYTDKYVLLAMTYEKVFDGIKANFEKIMNKDEVKVIDMDKSGKLE